MKIISLLPVMCVVLLLLLAVALSFLCLPVVRKSSKYNIVFMALIVPIFSIVALCLYGQWGAYPQLLDQTALRKVTQTLDNITHDAQASQASVVKTFDQLEKEIQYSPLALAELGNIYNQIGLFDRSISLFEKNIESVPVETEYQIQWVYSHSLKYQGKLPPFVREKANQLFAFSSQHKELINLLAIDDYFNAKFEAAIQKWDRLLNLDETLTEDRRAVIQNAIAKASSQLGIAEVVFKVSVRLASQFNAWINPQDTVFVFISQEDGPPLAVLKRTAKELPFTVDLDDKQSMLGPGQLHPGKKVTVVAKIVKSGDPLDKKNEIRGISAPLVIKSGVQTVNVVINQHTV